MCVSACNVGVYMCSCARVREHWVCTPVSAYVRVSECTCMRDGAHGLVCAPA